LRVEAGGFEVKRNDGSHNGIRLNIFMVIFTMITSVKYNIDVAS